MREHKDLFEEAKEGKKIFKELVEEFKTQIKEDEIFIKAYRKKDIGRRDPEECERAVKRLEEETEDLKKSVARIENYLKISPA